MRSPLFILCLIAGLQTKAQIVFQNSYSGFTMGGNYYVNGAGGTSTADGGYVLAGNHPNGYALIKLLPNGDTAWNKTYGYGMQAVYNVEQTRDKGFLISGSTSIYSYYGLMHLIKTDSLGDTLWTRAYSNTCPSAIAGVRQTLDGGYIVAERRSQWCTQGGQITSLYKIKPNGDTSWFKRTWGGGSAIALPADSGFVFAGCSVIKTNKYGDSLWVKAYGSLCVSAIEATADGGFILAGTTSYTSPDFFAIKTNGLGDTVWTRTYGSNKDENLVSVKTTNDGGYILAGTTKGVMGDSTDIYLVKIDSFGDTLWTRTIGRPGQEKIYTIHQAFDKGYFISENCEWSASNAAAALTVVKTDSLGRVYACNEHSISANVGFASVQVTRPATVFQPSALGYVPDSVPVNNFSPHVLDNCGIVAIAIHELHDESDLSIFPNPASDVLQVRSGRPLGDIFIYNVMGEIIYSSNNNGTYLQINLEGQPPGIYVVHVGSRIVKLIKE